MALRLYVSDVGVEVVADRLASDSFLLVRTSCTTLGVLGVNGRRARRFAILTMLPHFGAVRFSITSLLDPTGSAREQAVSSNRREKGTDVVICLLRLVRAAAPAARARVLSPSAFVTSEKPAKDLGWAREIRDQCVGVPYFLKQVGGVNKKKAGRLLEGRT